MDYLMPRYDIDTKKKNIYISLCITTFDTTFGENSFM